MKGNKGITLIALVITIIVLLILAGVSIAMLSGENSILKRAQDARNQSTAGSLEEAAKIAVGNIMTNNLGWPAGKKFTKADGKTSDATFTVKDVVDEINKVSGDVKASVASDDETKTGGEVEISATVSAGVTTSTQKIKLNMATGAITKVATPAETPAGGN